MSIVLYQYKPLYGMPNASPFCIKLETYLRMAMLEHRVVAIGGRNKSPTGKAPFVEIDGKLMCDSGLIIDHLERAHGHIVDGRLTLAQRAESLALQRLMEEHLYWVLVYARWVDPDHAAEIRTYIAQLIPLPWPMSVLVRTMIQRSIRATLHHHGIGRHAAETVWQMGAADIQALAHWLGNRTYGFGDGPTVFDAALFGCIGAIISTPWDFPLKTVALKHGNLTAHCARMKAQFFPELAAG